MTLLDINVVLRGRYPAVSFDTCTVMVVRGLPVIRLPDAELAICPLKTLCIYIYITARCRRASPKLLVWLWLRLLGSP